MIVTEKQQKDMDYEEAMKRVSLVSKKNSVYVILYNNDNELTVKEIAELLSGVSSVHVRKELNNISQDHLFETKVEGSRAKKYSLSPVGERHIERIVENYMRKMQVREDKFVLGENDLSYKNSKQVHVNQNVLQDIEEYVLARLSDDIVIASNSEYKILSVDFIDLSKFNPDIADIFVNDYMSGVLAFETVVERLEGYKPSISLFNLPKSTRADVRRIDSKHKNKLFYVDGVVRVVQTRKDRANIIRYECVDCGNIISLLQDNFEERKPSGCSECGNKRHRVLEKYFEPFIALRLEEKFEQVISSNSPQQKVVYVRGDALTRPDVEQRLTPGSRIRVIGYADMHQKTKGNSKLNQYETFIVANNIEVVEDSFDNIDLSDEDQEEMLGFAERAEKDLSVEFEKYIQSFVPHVVGHRETAKAVTLSLHSPADQLRSGNKKDRNRIHVMLLGDPGTCKTDFLRAAMNLAPRSRFATGDALTKVGLTASVIKDDLTGDFEVHAGLLALCDKTHAFIDELDKARPEDLNGLYSALETGEIDINKANLHTTINASTTVIFAANPKFGRFDIGEGSKPLSEQFDFPPPILDRCDLIVPVIDVVDEVNDANIARSVVTRKSSSEGNSDVSYSFEWMKKKILFVKKHSNIELPYTEEVEKKLGEYYVNQRLKSSRGKVTITPRTLEAFARLARAVAMFRHAWLTNGVVTVDDLDVAVNVWEQTTGKLIMDSEGNFNVDKLSGNLWVRTHRDKFIDWMKSQDNLVSHDDIISHLYSEHDMDEHDADKFLDSMVTYEVIFEPKPARYQLL
jgi:replicative DNA helicase Mcm